MSKNNDILLEKPWKPKKVRSLKLADSFKRLGQNKRSQRVRFCGSALAFAVNAETGEKKLHSADFCRERLCPMCAWRKSLKCYHEVSRVMDAAQIEQPDLVPVFLTLTLRNCSPDELSDTLDSLFHGWNRLNSHRRFKRIVKGWLRALEVTYNKKDDTFHPHIHVVIMVDKSYFTSKDYMQTEDWVQLWRTSMQLNYNPICDIRKVKGGKKAVKEVSKYTVKDTDYISDDTTLMDNLVNILGQALRGRRLYAFGGLLKKISKRLGAEQLEDGDLIHIDDDDVLREDVKQLIVVYRWHMGLSNYFADL